MMLEAESESESLFIGIGIGDRETALVELESQVPESFTTLI